MSLSGEQTNYRTFLIYYMLLIRKKCSFAVFAFHRKISVHQTSINANGKTLSVLRVNSTEKSDGGFYTCQVIIKLKLSYLHALGYFSCRG